MFEGSKLHKLCNARRVGVGSPDKLHKFGCYGPAEKAGYCRGMPACLQLLLLLVAPTLANSPAPCSTQQEREVAGGGADCRLRPLLLPLRPPHQPDLLQVLPSHVQVTCGHRYLVRNSEYLQVVRCTGGCGGGCAAVASREVQVEAVVVGAGWAQGPGQTTCTNLTVTEDTACICRPVKPACPSMVSW